MKRTICCFLFALVLGCSSEQPKPIGPPPALTALSIEEWKQLPVSEKYDEGSFERIRMGDPKLKSDAEWQKFMKHVVIPEREKDIPLRPGERAADP